MLVILTQKLTEGEVQGLGGEVTNDIGGVASPEGDETLFLVGTSESVADALVGGSQTTLLDLERTCQAAIHNDTRNASHHLILVLNEELDTLNGGSRGLCDSLRSKQVSGQHQL